MQRTKIKQIFPQYFCKFLLNPLQRIKCRFLSLPTVESGLYTDGVGILQRRIKYLVF